MPEEIQRVIKVYNHRKSDRLVAYQLVIEGDNHLKPYIKTEWLDNGHNHSHYVKLLKDYMQKHPELFVLGLIALFPQLSAVPLFGKLLMIRRFGF
jgi:hypothetical protein